MCPFLRRRLQFLCGMDLIKREFVRRILSEEGDRLVKNQGVAIRKRLEFRTGELENTRTTSVEGGEDLDGKLVFSHPIHERFLDMKRRVKRKRGEGTRIKYGYRIHNRFVFGHYGSIANRLMNEFTEQVAEGIRREFEQQMK